VQESSLAPRPRYEADGIVLRTLTTNAEYDEAVALQDEIWGAGFTDRVPASILRVAQKVGGVTAGAFDAQDRMLGFVFGLTGLRDGRPVHWSDMLAVREDARGKQLGEKLKTYQRDLVHAVGVETMFWTFDPLVARNAHFNLNRLGARIAEYIPNFYGSNTGSILHGALPTDRFVAEWQLTAADRKPRDTAAQQRERPAAGLARTAVAENGRVRVVEPLPDASRVLVPVPRDIEALLGASQEAALAWRLATREAIMHYLALGYQVTAFYRGTENELPAYELTHSPSRPA